MRWAIRAQTPAMVLPPWRPRSLSARFDELVVGVDVEQGGHVVGAYIVEGGDQTAEIINRFGQSRRRHRVRVGPLARILGIVNRCLGVGDAC